MATKSYQQKRQAIKAYRNLRRERPRDPEFQEPAHRESRDCPPQSSPQPPTQGVPGGGDTPPARVLPLGSGLAAEGLDETPGAQGPVPAALAAPRRAENRTIAPAGSQLPLLEIQEAIIQRLGHLGRRLEEVHQAGISRAAEERRETWILVLALSVVLVFCFAAFFMNQIEVRDVHTGLQEEIERRSGETIDSIEHALASLRLENLPRLHASVEKFLREKDQRDSAVFADMLAEVRRQGDRSGTQISESLRILEDHMQRIQRLSNEIHQLQMAARYQKSPHEGAETAAPVPAAGADGAARVLPAAATPSASAAAPAPEKPALSPLSTGVPLVTPKTPARGGR